MSWSHFCAASWAVTPLRTRSISLLFPVRGSTTFARIQKQPWLRKLLLNRHSREWSASWRLFLYFNIEGKLRYSGVSGSFDRSILQNGAMTVMSEINYPPFGYVLLMSGDPHEVLEESTTLEGAIGEALCRLHQDLEAPAARVDAGRGRPQREPDPVERPVRRVLVPRDHAGAPGGLADRVIVKQSHARDPRKVRATSPCQSATGGSRSAG